MLSRLAGSILFLSLGYGQIPSYVVSTAAGADPVQDNIPAMRSTVSFPQGIATDKDGNVYIADTGNHRIRKTLAGASAGASRIIVTVAGCGYAGFSGEGLPATQGRLLSPSAVAVDADGIIYIADSGNGRIRKVLANGTMITLAGNGETGIGPEGVPARQSPTNGVYGIAVDAKGVVYYSERDRIRKVSREGIVNTVPGAGGLNSPVQMATDSAGNLYAAESGSHRVVRIATDGKLTVVAGTGTAGSAGDGGPATAAQLNRPYGIASDSVGNLYIADTGNSTIRKVTPDGLISRALRITGISAYAVAFAGTVSSYSLYIAGGNGVTIASESGESFTYIPSAGYLGSGYPADRDPVSILNGIAADDNGNLFLSDASQLLMVTPAGTLAVVSTEASGLYGPSVMAIDRTGNLYITFGGFRVYKRTAGGQFSLVAGTSQSGFSGDGGPAIAAQLRSVIALAADAAGNLYIFGDNRIRRISPDGIIKTVAGTGVAGNTGDGGPAVSATLALSFGTGAAADAAGNVYFSSSDRIRKLDSNGTISTVAGGMGPGASRDGVPATRARFTGITGVVIDSYGSLVFTESGTHSLRTITSSGLVRTIAGRGTSSFGGDGGPAVLAAFATPTLLTADRRGNLLVFDKGNGRIRKLTPNPPSKLTVDSGNNQTGVAGACLAVPLRVKVNGPLGHGVPSANVTFTVSSGAAALTRGAAATGDDGIAQTEIAFGDAAGKVTVQASVAGLAPVEFALTSTTSTAPGAGCISKGGVVGAALGSEPVRKIAPGGLTTVFGQHLAASGTARALQVEDLAGGSIPTQLAGVCVRVAGIASPLLFVSPGQINFQAPAIEGRATADVQVVRNCGEVGETLSSPETVVVTAAAPEFLSFSSAASDAKPLIAVNATTGRFAGEPGLVAGVEFEAARKGDVLVLYGTGFGPTIPLVPAGQLATGAASVAAQAVVTVNNTELMPEDVLYVGAVPGFAGLFQVNLRLSLIMAGDSTIRIRIGTAESPGGVFLKTTP